MNINLKVWRHLSLAVVFGAAIHSASAGPQMAAPKSADPSSAIPKGSNQIADSKAPAPNVGGRREVVRRPAETLAKLADRILPRGARTVTRPVEMDFPPLVLSSVYEIGSGNHGRDYYDTDVYKWSGSTFLYVEQDENRSLYGLRNAKAVRARLKEIPLNRSVNETKALR